MGQSAPNLRSIPKARDFGEVSGERPWQRLKQYIAERKDVKASTAKTYEKARDNLVDYFGKNKLLREVTTADAKRWRIWLATEGNRRSNTKKTMAEETVRRRTGKVKQFMREAVERGLIHENRLPNSPAQVRATKQISSLFASIGLVDAFNNVPTKIGVPSSHSFGWAGLGVLPSC